MSQRTKLSGGFFVCTECFTNADKVVTQRCFQCCREMAEYDRVQREAPREPDPISFGYGGACGEGIDQFVHCTLSAGHFGPHRSGNWSSE